MITGAVLDIINGFLCNRDLTFTVVRAKPENSYVLEDTVRIREVQVNLLSNALKYTDDGGTIRFETDYHFGMDGLHMVVRYRVTDSGVGMSEEFVSTSMMYLPRRISAREPNTRTPASVWPSPNAMWN